MSEGILVDASDRFAVRWATNRAEMAADINAEDDKVAEGETISLENIQDPETVAMIAELVATTVAIRRIDPNNLLHKRRLELLETNAKIIRDRLDEAALEIAAAHIEEALTVNQTVNS
jgi:UDP-N-acetylglucosamine enolpyruvyl transferase